MVKGLHVSLSTEVSLSSLKCLFFLSLSLLGLREKKKMTALFSQSSGLGVLAVFVSTLLSRKGSSRGVCGLVNDGKCGYSRFSVGEKDEEQQRDSS